MQSVDELSLVRGKEVVVMYRKPSKELDRKAHHQLDLKEIELEDLK